MTAILDDIRRLDAAHARGEISAVELAAAKSGLIDAVPDVLDLAPSEVPEPTIEHARPGIGQALLLSALILTVCIGVSVLLTADIMLSATLGITVLAACTVVLFLQLDN